MFLKHKLRLGRRDVTALGRVVVCCAAAREAGELFRGTGAEAGKALRVSRYRDEGHVRFSVWDESGVAEAAVSVSDREAQRLAAFLGARDRVASVLERLRAQIG